MAGTVIGEALVDIKAGTTGFLSGIRGAMGQAEGMAGTMGDNMSSKLKGAGGIMTAGLTAPIVALGAFALQSSSVVGGAFKSIEKQTGATGVELEKLKGPFKSVFTTMPVDATTAANAISTISSRLKEMNGGVAASQGMITAVSTGFLMFAKVTGVDAKAAADSLMGSFKLFSVTADEIPGKLNALTIASQQTGIPMETLIADMKKASPVLSQMGFDFDEGAAQIAKLEASGVKVQPVINGLGKVMKEAAEAGKSPKLAFSELSAELAKGTHTGKEAEALYKELGPKAFQQMSAAAASGAFNISDLTSKMESNDDQLKNNYEDTMTFGDKLEIFKNKLMVAFEPLGKILINVFTNVLTALTPFLNVLTNVMAAFSHAPPAVQMLVVALGAIIAAIGPVLMLIGMMMPALAVIGPIIMGTILPAIGAILIPLLPIIIAVALIGVLLYLLYTRFKPFHDAVDQVMKWIKLLLGDLMSGDFGKLGEDFKKGILGALDVLKKFDWGSIPTAILNALKSLDWGGAFETLKKFFMSGGLAGMLFNALKSLDWGSAFETLKKFFMSGGLAGMLFRALISIDWGGLGMAIWNAVKSFFNPKFFTLLTDQLLGIGQWLWDNITSKLIGFGVWFIMLQATIGIRLWSWIIAALSGFGTWLWSLISPLPMQLWNAYVSFWSKIGTWLWGLISPLPGQLWNGIVSALGSFGSWLLGLLPDIGGQIWTSITNALGNFGSWLANAISQAHIEFDIPVINQHVSFNLASGGMVKARPGGVLAVIGEGGEDEYVVPKSKLGDFGAIASMPHMAGGGMVSGGAVSSFSSSKAATTGGDFHFAISIENATLTSLDEADKLGQRIAYNASEAMRRAGHTRG